MKAGHVGPLGRVLTLLLACSPALACEYPDEGGMPLRRAVTKVQILSDVEAWAEAMRRNRIHVQYLVRLDEPVRQGGRCYWPVDVVAEGKLWRSFLVTPDGKSILPKKEN
jgi:hypothetical protein